MSDKTHILARTLIIFIIVLSIFSCTRIKYGPVDNIQTGKASWYGPKFHGNPTSNQETFNMFELTAAHRTLPFNTYVMVTNLSNGKSVVVRINDRGPFIKGRIIDLSYAAAKVLEIIEPGVVSVKLEILSKNLPETDTKDFSVQVGAFISEINAKILMKKLQKKFKNVYLSLYKTSHKIYYRVRIKAESLNEARKISKRLNQEGYSVLIKNEKYPFP